MVDYYVIILIVTPCGSKHQTLEACRLEPFTREQMEKLSLEKSPETWYGLVVFFKPSIQDHRGKLTLIH